MVDNSNMPYPKCLGSQKNPGTEPKTCEKGPKLGFEYLPTSKTSHCVHGIPIVWCNPPMGGSSLHDRPSHPPTGGTGLTFGKGGLQGVQAVRQDRGRLGMLDCIEGQRPLRFGGVGGPCVAGPFARGPSNGQVAVSTLGSCRACPTAVIAFCPSAIVW